ncbi:hypothetical protein MOVS_06085 [Moraxella ovis]|uniref:DUF4377 domain-containing protein n=1 Tax=Moraxella ovis TaxID=29433 RepID=A0A378PKH1_9GAMM|nr:DUF4377 domain-containing protein [Moraxella ovis]ANB91621.1 hypothetical protein MOVS_06085 [Moraxella ovis]STY87272.1 Uncharacterised protein [Moraxella ovis]
MKKSIKPLYLLTLLSGTLFMSACQKSPPVPEPLYIPSIALGEALVLDVLPNRAPCQSTTPMQCLLVKKEGAPTSEVFGIGYNDIHGFEPRQGVSYKIRVYEQIDENTGKPTVAWQLNEILSQQISR